MTEKELLIEKIKEIAGWNISPFRLRIITDTSDWMSITTGNVLRIGNKDFLIRGNMREPRFGIDDQPKYWVFHAISLEDGSEKIIKTVFKEEFYAHIGILRLRCYRDVDKESKVLELTKGDMRFMQGYTEHDDKGNNVRIIDFIRGKTFFHYIPGIDKTHENYFYEDLPEILWKLKGAIEAIKLLHDNGLCHGDIRNDHLLIESETNNFRWIDFDLKQDVADFDLWSFGNVINYAVGKGIITFDNALKNKNISDEIKNNLDKDDASAFYNYRIMNISKIFRYIPDSLTKLLQHFTIKPIAYYSSINEFFEDYSNVLEKDFSEKK